MAGKYKFRCERLVKEVSGHVSLPTGNPSQSLDPQADLFKITDGWK